MTPRHKAGTSKTATQDRKKAFVDTYIANGHNGTQAAIAAGYAPKSAHVTAAQLLKDPKVAEILAEHAARAATNAGLTSDRVIEEVHCLMSADPRKLYREDGTLKEIHELDDATAAAVSSIEFGEDGKPKKVRLWDKNTALVTAARHLGLFEKDNKQRIPVRVEIELVG